MTVTASGYAVQENELYQTEPWATRALLHHRPLAGFRVWEACAGNHLMADVLREHGASVVTSDIATYIRQHDCIFDFFSDVPSPFGDVQAIVTNPPYGKGNRLAAEFARKALQRCPGVIALLLTAKFDFGKTRFDLFRDNPRFAFKIALTDRIQWFPGETGGTEDHAWFVWGPVGAKHTPRLIWEGRDI